MKTKKRNIDESKPTIFIAWIIVLSEKGEWHVSSWNKSTDCPIFWKFNDENFRDRNKCFYHIVNWEIQNKALSKLKDYFDVWLHLQTLHNNQHTARSE